MQYTSSTDWSKLELAVLAQRMFSNSRIDVIQLTLKPGEKLETHKNDVDVWFLILNGTGRLIIEKQELKVKQNDSVFIEKQEDRYWENEGNIDLQVLVVKMKSS